jgi:hypothetical protein
MGAQSNGCATCKRRKVKCDETHPKCTRCSAAGVECTGFALRLKFVDERPRIKRRAAVIQAQSHEFFTRTSKSNLSNLSFHSSWRRSPRPQPFASPFLAPTLSLTAFKDDIFISFLVFKFFKLEHSTTLYTAKESSCGLPVDWTHYLINTPQKSRSKSWDALAAIVYGQAYQSYDVITSALQLYWQALSELRKLLSESRERHTHSTLASITALYIYQVGPKNMLRASE